MADTRIDEQGLRHFRQADEGVGCDEFGFQIGQRANAVVFLFVPVGLLVANEGDEEAKLRDLDSDGLDVHAIETVFDEVELAAVVVVVVGKSAFKFLAHRSGVKFGQLGLLPAFVVGIELSEDENELVEDAHGKGAGAAGGVQNL